MRALPEISPQDELLLLFAMIELSDEKKNKARALVSEIDDWQAFFELAHRNHSLPLAQKHLRDLGVDTIPEVTKSQVNGTVMKQTFHNLNTISALFEFIDTCLTPLDVPYFVFKGITFAEKFYPSVGMRPCRDVDIALKPEDLEKVVRKAAAEGYDLWAPNGKGQPLTEDRDIKVLMQYARSAVLISPKGIAFDIQPGIDKFSGIFDSYDVFENLQSLEIGGREVPVLAPEFLFNYICHHHARHLWSRLHWISDIDAIMRSPDLDLDKALEMAKRFGQLGTVEAAIEFRRLLTGEIRAEDHTTSHGWDFMQLCVANLAGDLALEKRMATQLIGGEFRFQWQAEDWLRKKARRNWLIAMLSPSYSQYQAVPLPPFLRWMYYPSRVVQLAWGFTSRNLNV